VFTERYKLKLQIQFRLILLSEAVVPNLRSQSKSGSGGGGGVVSRRVAKGVSGERNKHEKSKFVSGFKSDLRSNIKNLIFF
jgi:hypothetical protein